MLLRRALLVLSILCCFGVLSPADHAAALCAMPAPSGRILTPLDRPVPRDGSLLVSFDYGYVRGGVPVVSAPDGQLRLAAEPVLVRGNVRIRLQATPLPGGFVRLDFGRPPATGAYTLEGLTPEGVVPPTVTIGGALPEAPAAPEVTRVTHVARRETHEAPRGTYDTEQLTTRVTLARPVASPNAMLLLEPVAGGDVQVMGTSGGTELLAEVTLGGRCGSPMAPGRGHVSVGAAVRARVLDIYGRLSGPSADVQVRPGRARPR